MAPIAILGPHCRTGAGPRLALSSDRRSAPAPQQDQQVEDADRAVCRAAGSEHQRCVHGHGPKCVATAAASCPLTTPSP